MLGLSWNYTRCLSSSSMVHLCGAWLLLLWHWKCAWEALYVEDVSFKLNKMWGHLIDCMSKERDNEPSPKTHPNQKCLPLHTFIVRMIKVYCWWVFVERVRNKSMGSKKTGSSWIQAQDLLNVLVRHSYHKATWTPGRGEEDKLHKQHCLKASANSNCNLAKASGPLTSQSYSEGLGFESQLDPGFFSVDLFLTQQRHHPSWALTIITSK